MAYQIIDPRIWIAVAYKRRSREDVEAERYGKHETLAKQHRLIELIAKDEYDVKITEWFEEIESGETIAGRPEFKRLLKDLLADRWKAKAQGKRMALFAKEPSRLGRGGGADRDRIINALKVSKTYFVTPEKVYDPENPKDMKLLRKELEDASEEREQSVWRLTNGVKDAVREGCYMGGVEPYGWKRVRINRKWTLEPDPVEHPRLMTFYDLVDYEDYKVFDVKLYAEEHGWPNPKGGAIWKKQTLRDMLCNDVNAGYVSHGKHKTVEDADEHTLDPIKVRREVGEDDPDYVKAEGLHMGNGTISMERLERVRRKIHTGLPTNDDKSLKNVLSHILRCGECKYAMIRRQQTSRRYKAVKDSGKPYVRFEHPDDVETTCRCKGAPYDEVMNCLVHALKVKYAGLEVLLTDEGKRKDRKRIEKRIARLEKDLSVALAACDKIKYAWETDRYSDEEFDARIEVARANVKSIEESIAREREDLPDESSIRAEMYMCTKIIDTLLDETLDAGTKNEMLREWIDHIYYWNDAPPRVRWNKIRLDISFVE